eukprot:835173_1
MAQIEDDKTNQWLNENELDSIIDTCNKHKITLEVLMVADVDDLRSLCKEAQMPTTIMLKLKNALMKTADSVLGTQKQIIVVSSEEKTLKDKFDQVFKKLRIMLQQNQQCQSTLESKKNNAINNINSSMDEIIEIIELKRRNLIDEINVMSEEHSKKLNQQKIKHLIQINEQNTYIKKILHKLPQKQNHYISHNNKKLLQNLNTV